MCNEDLSLSCDMCEVNKLNIFKQQESFIEKGLVQTRDTRSSGLNTCRVSLVQSDSVSRTGDG